MAIDSDQTRAGDPIAQISGKLTPLMQQYWDVKSAHADKIVLFRMGDFFEMFHSDAETAAPVLGIALTSRNKKAADETPMCGVPHHSVAASINKLLQNGFKVAICDQIEDPKFAKGLVKRAVTRILSPGVVYDPDTLDGSRANYLASFDLEAVSFLDTTTGEAFYFRVKDAGRRNRLLCSLQPVEVILADPADSEPAAVRSVAGATAATPTMSAVMQASWLEAGFEPLLTTHGFSTRNWPAAVQKLPSCARRLLDYAVHMQGSRVLETITAFEERAALDRMELTNTVLRHLEVFESYRGDVKGSVFQAVNRCRTSMGARLLRDWLQFPLSEVNAIEKRLARVAAWQCEPERLKAIRTVFARLGDVQRRLGKLATPNCHPRDLQSLADSLEAGLEVLLIAESLLDPSLLAKNVDVVSRVRADIRAVLVDEPPLQLKSGGFIRSGVSPELDELIELSTNSHRLIMELEAREKELTGIGSLKVRFNNVFGYYIEITNTHKDRVPKDRYERKQTLANAERYLTPELAELESKVLSAQSKRQELESDLFEKLNQRCLKEARVLLESARLWAELDVFTSLAWLAIEQSYARPSFTDDGSLRLKASRHPVIEQRLAVPFVANDVDLARGGCLLLTGPNMAGKSTIMRQVAITALLAQAGSFVPAAAASLPVFDRIFTRIGASDSLSEGLSTFMVEMKETAEIIENASENSLVILDEIGRGTSTYDGLSLAQALLEHIVDRLGAMTLFATHYHELTQLASTYPHLHNAHMAIHEKPVGTGATSGRDAEIVFLHQLVKGPANKSYGIHVARIAGIPGSVTKRAAMLLKNLEHEHRIGAVDQMSLLAMIDRDRETPATLDDAEVTLESSKREAEHAALSEIGKLDLTSVTPLEALNRIAKWQQSLS